MTTSKPVAYSLTDGSVVCLRHAYHVLTQKAIEGAYAFWPWEEGADKVCDACDVCADVRHGRTHVDDIDYDDAMMA